MILPFSHYFSTMVSRLHWLISPIIHTSPCSLHLIVSDREKQEMKLTIMFLYTA